jgi:hypothetical protein
MNLNLSGLIDFMTFEKIVRYERFKIILLLSIANPLS